MTLAFRVCWISRTTMAALLAARSGFPKVYKGKDKTFFFFMGSSTDKTRAVLP